MCRDSVAGGVCRRLQAVSLVEGVCPAAVPVCNRAQVVVRDPSASFVGRSGGKGVEQAKDGQGGTSAVSSRVRVSKLCACWCCWLLRWRVLCVWWVSSRSIFVRWVAARQELAPRATAKRRVARWDVEGYIVGQ